LEKKPKATEWSDHQTVSDVAYAAKIIVNVKAGREVKQGCCLSPILFSLYIEYLTNRRTNNSHCKSQMTLSSWLRKKWCYRA
jgi:hypothetical protein